MEATLQKFDAQDSRPVKIFFQDEARFGRISTPTYCWAKAGIRPWIKTQFVREYTHVFSAVCPQDGASFSLILPYADSEAMNLFLEALAQHYSNQRIVLIFDGAAWHRSQMVKPFENIQFIFLPPYSPEVNPTEHLWEHIREKYLKNHLWLTMDLLESKLEDILRLVSQATENIKQLTGFHWTIFNV